MVRDNVQKMCYDALNYLVYCVGMSYVYHVCDVGSSACELRCDAKCRSETLIAVSLDNLKRDLAEQPSGPGTGVLCPSYVVYDGVMM